MYTSMVLGQLEVPPPANGLEAKWSSSMGALKQLPTSCAHAGASQTCGHDALFYSLMCEHQLCLFTFWNCSMSVGCQLLLSENLSPNKVAPCLSTSISLWTSAPNWQLTNPNASSFSTMVENSPNAEHRVCFSPFTPLQHSQFRSLFA